MRKRDIKTLTCSTHKATNSLHPCSTPKNVFFFRCISAPWALPWQTPVPGCRCCCCCSSFLSLSFSFSEFPAHARSFLRFLMTLCFVHFNLWTPTKSSCHMRHEHARERYLLSCGVLKRTPSLVILLMLQKSGDHHL